MKLKICALFTVLLMGRVVESSRDVMKAININFAKALDLCKTEMDLPDAINNEFLNFWNEGYELSEPLTGCAIICLSTRLKLLESDGSLQNENAQELARKHGADEIMAKQLVELLHQCEVAAPANDDACLKVLGIAKCFKAAIRILNWSPDMELIMGDTSSAA